MKEKKSSYFTFSHCYYFNLQKYRAPGQRQPIIFTFSTKSRTLKICKQGVIQNKEKNILILVAEANIISFINKLRNCGFYFIELQMYCKVYIILYYISPKMGKKFGIPPSVRQTHSWDLNNLVILQYNYKYKWLKVSVFSSSLIYLKGDLLSKTCFRAGLPNNDFLRIKTKN